MVTDEKLAMLDQIYNLYDEYTDTLDTVCKKGCADCCTCNVTLTTIEGYKIISAIDEGQKHDLWHRLLNQLNKPRFLPKITINQLADLCVSGADLPEDEVDSSWEACPILTENICPIYVNRPFGCRCLISTIDCKISEAAEIDEFTLTVNNLFMQVIEHIDQKGSFGNLTDILVSAIKKNNIACFENTADPGHLHLISNFPARTFLVPPQHQEKIHPIFSQIRKLIP